MLHQAPRAGKAGGRPVGPAQPRPARRNLTHCRLAGAGFFEGKAWFQTCGLRLTV